MDRDERVTRVVLAGEERVLLQPVELLAERSDARFDLAGHLAVHPEQLLGVLVLLREAAVAVEPAAQPRVLGRDLGRALLVVPEARLAELSLQLRDALLERVRVKGNHGPRRAGPRSPGAADRAAWKASGRSFRAMVPLAARALETATSGV